MRVAILFETKLGMHFVTAQNILVDMGSSEQIFEIILKYSGLLSPANYVCECFVSLSLSFRDKG